MFCEDRASSSSRVSAAYRAAYSTRTLSSTLTWIKRITFSVHHAGRLVEADDDEDCDDTASLFAA